MITNIDLLDGVYACLYNAKKFYDTAKGLYDRGDYQSSIPLSTISVEETMKGIALLTAFRKGNDISEHDWLKLTNHKYKLTHVFDEHASTIQSASGQDLDRVRSATARSHPHLPDLDPTDVINGLKSKSYAYSFFKDLRESCFYTGWSKNQKDWLRFDRSTKETRKALAFFVASEASHSLELFKSFVEREINAIRNEGYTLKDLPYPDYPEYRPPKRQHSAHTRGRLDKYEAILYKKGEKILKEFIKEKNFERISNTVLTNAYRKYLGVLIKPPPDEWYPHPMVKAVAMAADRLSRDPDAGGGPICVTTGDAEQTYEGKPMIVFCIVAKMHNGMFQIEKLTHVSNPSTDLDNDMIEKILRTEIVIERCRGKDVTANIFIEALSTIGIKTKMIPMKEIKDAIVTSKRMLAGGNSKDLPDFIANEVKLILSADEWDSLDTRTRAHIVTVYGMKKYPGYNMFITPSDNIRKHKLRTTVLRSLKQQYLPTA